MSKALDKILAIEEKHQSGWMEKARQRKENRVWTKRSFRIAVLILREIRRQKPINGMTQKMLAQKLGVSAQYINKVVKGNENLTLETIGRIEEVLGITLIEIPVSERTFDVSVEDGEMDDPLFYNQASSFAYKVFESDTIYTKPNETNG